VPLVQIHIMVLAVGESSKGLVTRSSISAKLWHSCTELANRALTDAFVSQLAAGTLQKVSFQHYIAQDAFFLAAFDKAYERAQDHVEDVGAKESLQELRESVLTELQLHEGYAKVGRQSPFPQDRCAQFCFNFFLYIFAVQSWRPSQNWRICHGGAMVWFSSNLWLSSFRNPVMELQK
jgi:hypothetical protein